MKYAAWRTPLSPGKSKACSRKKGKGTKVKAKGYNHALARVRGGSLVSQRKRAQLIVSSFTDFTSVKISNNALNFLLAQYRAIFKRAYVKGIASAVLLTAGLAAGQAQADNLTNTNLPDTNETATIIGDPNATA